MENFSSVIFGSLAVELIPTLKNIPTTEIRAFHLYANGTVWCPAGVVEMTDNIVSGRLP
ncbi:hypothetical protein [Microcoleus sp. CAWBG58]|uniref:hypothetical protein n=1 Tax=Microcoleus sp. CAWBG58 TaxID=2841651 RepID=UPI0025ED2C60|nr:hypothetical protein [Microcoleus sp. CAWBG58]